MRPFACVLLALLIPIAPATRLDTILVPPRTRLVCGGDVMLSRYVGRLARWKADRSFSFRGLAPALSSADIAFVNLESPFSDRGRPVEKGMVFKAEPDMIEGLKMAGIDVISTANNHARDRGSYGLEYTLRWAAANGIAVVGTGLVPAAAHEGAIVERHGTRFGFLAYTYDQTNGNYPDQDPRVAVLDAGQMRKDVRALSIRADVVIVSMHAGVEYQATPHPQQVEFARAAIDAGASVVIGHHPHVIQPVERYKHGVIFYSLGNLVFDQFQRRDTQEGLLGEITFLGREIERCETKRVEIVNAVPRLAAGPPTFLSRPGLDPEAGGPEQSAVAPLPQSRPGQ